MLVHGYFVVLAFFSLGMALISRYIKQRKEGKDFLEKPPIDKFDFYAGKIALLSTWMFFILTAILPGLSFIRVPVVLSWTAVGLLYAGSLIILIAYKNMGSNLSVGIPNESSHLITTGLYGLSRNPIYFGVFLIGLASCLYFPDLINISFFLFGIFIQHRIIIGEEAFLSARFGSEWNQYRTRVRRYI